MTHSAHHFRPLLWLVAMAFFMQALDSTIVNTALPAMAASLGESPLRMQSVIIAYMLTMATVIPASGWLADRVGTRRTFFSAIFLFTLGSVCCAAAHTLNQLVAARVLQGLGGAMLLPVGRLTVLRALPRELFLPAMSFITVPGLLGPLIGPTLGGWLVQWASWHWIFLINVPIGLVGGIVALRVMPDLRRDPGRFDLSGYLQLAAGMVALSIAMDGLAERGLHQATVLVLLLFGLAAICAYWLHAGSRPDPLFNLDLFRIPSFRVGVLGNLFSRIGSGSMPFLLPLLLQLSLGYSPAQSGMTLIPVALAAMSVKRITTPLIRHFGYRHILVGNTLLVGLLMASFALCSNQEPLWLRLLQLACLGAANSMQFTAMNTLALKDMDERLASSGNSLLSMVMMLSMSLAVACAGTLLLGFSQFLGSTHDRLPAFHATFVSMGLITCCAAWIFWQLPADEPGAGKAPLAAIADD